MVFLPADLIIVSLLLTSQLMTTATLSVRPLVSRAENWSEVIDEVLILLVVYHILCFSDFVPLQQKTERDWVGFSHMALVTFSLFAFISSIAWTMASNFYRANKRKFYQKKFETAQIDMVHSALVQEAAVAQLIKIQEERLANWEQCGYTLFDEGK